MNQDLERRLLGIGSRMVRLMPDVAPELARIPEASGLTLCDLAVLLLHAPCEEVAPSAVENIVGAANADSVIGVLTGHGLVSEEIAGSTRITTRGRDLVDELLRIRLNQMRRLLDQLPADRQEAVIRDLEEVSNLANTEALVEA